MSASHNGLVNTPQGRNPLGQPCPPTTPPHKAETLTWLLRGQRREPERPALPPGVRQRSQPRDLSDQLQKQRTECSLKIKRHKSSKTASFPSLCPFSIRQPGHSSVSGSPPTMGSVPCPQPLSNPQGLPVTSLWAGDTRARTPTDTRSGTPSKGTSAKGHPVRNTRPWAPGPTAAPHPGDGLQDAVAGHQAGQGPLLFSWLPAIPRPSIPVTGRSETTRKHQPREARTDPAAPTPRMARGQGTPRSRRGSGPGPHSPLGAGPVGAVGGAGGPGGGRPAAAQPAAQQLPPHAARAIIERPRCRATAAGAAEKTERPRGAVSPGGPPAGRRWPPHRAPGRAGPAGAKPREAVSGGGSPSRGEG